MYATLQQVRPTTDVRTLAAWTDEELLLAYRDRGERAAFEELVQRYENELYGYLRHYLGSTEQAEDVFQQTFLQVHLKCGQFEVGRSVRPWLYTVATNQAIDYQRRNRRHRMASLDRRAGHNEDDQPSLSARIGSPVADPAMQSQCNERDAVLRKAVDELPPATKQLIALVYFQGLKYREAADVLSIPVGTVKSRLHVALGKLHEVMAASEA